jgi:DNA mismatch repair protein MutL
VAGDLVDVNVHPQKREVRLRQEQLIKELIIKAVRSGISHGHALFSADPPAEGISPVFAKAFQSHDTSRFQDVPETWVLQKKAPSNAPPIPPPSPMIGKPPFPPPGEQQPMTRQPASAIPFRETPFKELPDQRRAPPSELSLTLPTQKYQPLKVLATIPCYIILDGSLSHPFIEKGCRHPEIGGMLLIDQKNAHSRILFEKLSQMQSGCPIAQQALLIPHSIELPPHESEALRTAIPSLNKMGIHIREFGAHTFLIDSIPQMFGSGNLDILIAHIIHDLRSLHTCQTSEQIVLRDQAKRIAQAAVRAAGPLQRRLSLLEAQSILDQLAGCQQPYLCPSGKPILAQVTLDELAKLFQR